MHPRAPAECTGATAVAARAGVTQAEALVDASTARLRSARGERLPAVVLQSTYNRYGYPKSGFPEWEQTQCYSPQPQWDWN